MINYNITNLDSGEVRFFEGEEITKLHNTFKKLIKFEIEHFPNTTLKVKVDGENLKEVSECEDKIIRYINRKNLKILPIKNENDNYIHFKI